MNKRKSWGWPVSSSGTTFRSERWRCSWRWSPRPEASASSASCSWSGRPPASCGQDSPGTRPSTTSCRRWRSEAFLIHSHYELLYSCHYSHYPISIRSQYLIRAHSIVECTWCCISYSRYICRLNWSCCLGVTSKYHAEDESLKVIHSNHSRLSQMLHQ